MDYVTPIGSDQQNLVVVRTQDYLDRARQHFGRDFAPLPVRFDLRGRASGMYRVKGGSREIRYNPWLFAAYFDDCLDATVPHEVAHYITDALFGLRNIRPHGREWKAVMAVFDADPSVTANYSLEGIPLRRSTRVRYLCPCDSHMLGIRRHQKVVAGMARYRCRRCGEILTPGQL